MAEILVIGAGGSTGRLVVDKALERGFTVRAGEREPEDDARTGVTPVTADILDPKSLTAAIRGVDAVVSAVGLPMSDPRTVLDPPPIYKDGVRNTVSAMRETGVDRLVVISATFVDTKRRGPVWFEAAAASVLSGLFDRMGDMETYLAAQEDIRWTAVRPGWLLDEPSTHEYTVSEDVIPEDHIRTRFGDLADFIVSAIADGTYVRQTPAISRKEAADKSSPFKLVEELAD